MNPEPAPRPPLDAPALRRVAGFDIEVVVEAGSTNAIVAERAAGGAAEGLVVVAEHQTSGRGRMDRVWETPARAALTFSLLVRPRRDPVEWSWLPLLAGVALVGAIRQAGVTADLKWPNDVLVDGLKLAGVLVERVETHAGPAAVVGIGVNVTTRADELPVATATSLALAGASVDRTALLVETLDRFRREYAAWQQPEGPAALRAEYASLCSTARGQSVRVDLPTGESLTGRGRGITAAGALEVETDGGTVTVTAGDVVHVRAGNQ